MKIKIINHSQNILPSYETEGSSGMDIRSNEVVSIPPLGRRSVNTGLFMELPLGYEAQIRPRSGLALKQGITVLNAPGTIDSDFRGEIGIILFNASNIGVTVFKGDRIAQMVIANYEKVSWEEAEKLTETERGSGGFGSTGV